MLSSPDCITLCDEMELSAINILCVNASPTFIVRPKKSPGSFLERGNLTSALQ